MEPQYWRSDPASLGVQKPSARRQVKLKLPLPASPQSHSTLFCNPLSIWVHNPPRLGTNPTIDPVTPEKSRSVSAV